MTGDTWPGTLTSFIRGRPDNSWRDIKARPNAQQLASAEVFCHCKSTYGCACKAGQLSYPWFITQGTITQGTISKAIRPRLTLQLPMPACRGTYLAT